MQALSEFFPIVAPTVAIATQTGVPQVTVAKVTRLFTGRAPTKLEKKWDKKPLKERLYRATIFATSAVLGTLTFIYKLDQFLQPITPQPQENQPTSHTMARRSISHHISRRNTGPSCGPGDVFRVTDGQGNNLIHATNDSVSFMNGKMSVTPSQFQVTGNLPIVATDSSIKMGQKPGTVSTELIPTAFKVYYPTGSGGDSFPS